MAKYSELILYWNTPLTKLNETVHFETGSERDQWLKSYPHQTFEQFNWVRDRLQIRVGIPYQFTNGINYCTIRSGHDGVTYCYYIMASAAYSNDNTTVFEIVPDVLMTFTQGNVLNRIKNVWIHRQHLTEAHYQNRLLELRTNSDVLKCTTKRYCHTETVIFTNYVVLFHCSVKLDASYGSQDKPKIITSSGIVYDKLASPVGLYYCEYSDWGAFCAYIKNFPWVAQCISNIILLPKSFIDESDLSSISLNNGDKDGVIKAFKNGGTSTNKHLITITKDKIKQVTGWESDEYLRSEYATLEITSYDGQLLALDLAELPDEGLKLEMMNTIGFANEIRIYPADWAEKGDNLAHPNIGKGSFLNQSIVFNNWTQLPMLIDNYRLSLANNANQRHYAESRTLTGRTNAVQRELGDVSRNGLNASNGQDLFVDAYAILGGGLHPATLAAKMIDDVEFYRQQKAQFADLALSPPSLSASSSTHAFQISNQIFGIVIKMSAPTTAEKNKIRRYYSTMGYEFEEFGNVLDIHSMSICNYLQVQGNFTLDDVPAGYLQMIQGLLSQGVRFWHHNHLKNPFQQDVLQNERRV